MSSIMCWRSGLMASVFTRRLINYARGQNAMTAIPPSIIGTVSPILADAYTHAQLNALFMAARFPGDAPEGNKIEKCRNWLRRANSECDDPLRMFGVDRRVHGC
jgi:hypothetical protein